VVLPILEEFKPDLIINSAGQDNHYSDPITNMCFSAQGYALLNDKLSPHIAVLEGGYSIEHALPYVNVGIILAMAGLDYSAIREPDYNPAAIRQSPETTAYIERVAESIYKQWVNRDRLKNVNEVVNGYVTRKKRIYYDTDGILEYQEESIRLCDHCGGLLLIESQPDHGEPGSLPFVCPGNSCAFCRQEGEEVFASTSARKYNYVFFQDRDRDVFLVK